MTSETGGEESTPPKAPARAPRRRPAAGTAKTAAAAAAPTTTTSASTRTARSATSKTGTKPTTTRTKTTARPTKASQPTTQQESQAAVAATMTIETTERIRPAQPPKPSVLTLTGLHKRFGEIVAVDGVTLEVAEGSFYGIVGPNGAGKTTTLSMVTGLLRPDAGRIVVHGVDVWSDPVKAKRSLGVLPDKLRMFDRLTGAQLLHYAGSLRGLSGQTVRSRSADLARAFGIEDALDRLVADYSAGMTKKIALAAAMIHSPRLLVLDEPFESVDPVSAANVIDILQRYVAAGGTVVVSSHGMDLIQRVCDSVAIIVRGQVLAAGTIDQVRGEQTLEERFVELAGGRKAAEGMEWLHSFSD
jgi:ABC-2 type transport system ATP-binding protein